VIKQTVVILEEYHFS